MHRLTIPDYPRTPHLAYKPNTQTGDVVSEDHESQIVINNPLAFFEEKIDGANCAIMCTDSGNPIIRNRTNILKKGYVKDTPAKIQFRPIWNWFYDNKKKFESLNNLFGEPVAVYGEWCLALHGIRYDRLPDYFIGFDIWIPSRDMFVRTDQTREYLREIGISIPELIYNGAIPSFQTLDMMTNGPSLFSETDKVEGVYIKIIDHEKVIKRFKFIRQDYVQGEKWCHEQITKQLIY